MTVGLSDGTAVAGDVAAYTVDDRPVRERELVIANPEVRTAGATAFHLIKDNFVVPHGENINSLAVIRYEVVRPKGRDRRKLKMWFSPG